MGGASKPTMSSFTTTSRQTTSPWGPTQEDLKEAVAWSKRISEDELQWPGFQTFTGLDPRQTDALALMEARARAGSPQIPAAQDLNLAMMRGDLNNPGIAALQETARGDFLTGDTNPYTQALIDRTLANVAGQASVGGRLGSGYATGAATEAMAPILAGQFDVERSRQERARENLAHIYQQDLMNRAGAADRAGTMALMDFQDPQILQDVGAQYRQVDDLALQERLKEFGFLQNEEQARLAAHLSRLLPISGTGGEMVTKQEHPYMQAGKDRFGNAMQIAGMGLKLGGMMGMCDHRLKDNIEDLPDGALDNVLKLKPKRYNYRAEYGFDPSTTEGFLAHEVQGVLPDAVTGTYNGVEPQLVDVLSILATVTKAMQELCVKVDRLEKRLETNHGA